MPLSCQPWADLENTIDSTREALLLAAGQDRGVAGASALSVVVSLTRSVPRRLAVYSMFQSKDGLLDALAQRAFELLRDAISDLPTTGDPFGI